MISIHDVVAGGYAVNCKTKLEADEFVAAVTAMFPRECKLWRDSLYDVNGEGTCYCFSDERGRENRMYFSNIEFYRGRQNTVIIKPCDISFSSEELGEIDGEGMPIEFLFGALEVAE